MTSLHSKLLQYRRYFSVFLSLNNSNELLHLGDPFMKDGQFAVPNVFTTIMEIPPNHWSTIENDFIYQYLITGLDNDKGILFAKYLLAHSIYSLNSRNLPRNQFALKNLNKLINKIKIRQVFFTRKIQIDFPNDRIGFN